MKLCTRAGEKCFVAGVDVPVDTFVQLGAGRLRQMRSLLRLHDRLEARLRATPCNGIYVPFVGDKINRNSAILNGYLLVNCLIAPLMSAGLEDLIYGGIIVYDWTKLASLAFSCLGAWDTYTWLTIAQEVCGKLDTRKQLEDDIVALSRGGHAANSVHATPARSPGEALAFAYGETHNTAEAHLREFVIGSIDIAAARALRRLEAKEKQQQP